MKKTTNHSKNKKNISILLVVFSFGLVGYMSSVNFANAAVDSETQKAASRFGAATVTEINFSKESGDLSEDAKKELQQVLTEAGKKGTIKEVRVAAWADQEYPPKGVDLAGSQVDLAEKRAGSVQLYLEKSLNVASVSTLNMAERPSRVQDLLKTKAAKTKNTLENTGAAPTDSDHTGLFGLKGKASQAVIMIYNK
ncbi:MAG: hypothetical protein SGJ18_11500 [Pseudomonadota bacterium]|nr:hypothetical protein [Pseudomonadota bacterium]